MNPKNKSQSSKKNIDNQKDNKQKIGLNLFGHPKYSSEGSQYSLRKILGNPEVETVGQIISETMINKTKASNNQNDTWSSNSASSLPIGFQIHEYQINNILRQDRFGISYLATDLNLNYKVGIKEYLPMAIATRSHNLDIVPRAPNNFDIYQYGLEKFLIEARVLATFRINSIVRINRFFESQGTAYMVIGYEDSEQLQTWWPSHADMDEVEILSTFLPLLDGLSKVHEANYFHLNISPATIFIRSQDNSIVLHDFGTAQHLMEMNYPEVFIMGEDFKENYYGNRNVTSQINSSDYVETSTSEDSKINQTKDIYSIASTLFWMLTGTFLSSYSEDSRNINNRRKISEFNEQLSFKYSQEFLQAINWALEIDPEKRPQSITQWQNILFSGNVGALDLKKALLTQNFSEGNYLSSKKTQIGKITKLKKYLAWKWQRIFKVSNWALSAKISIIMIIVSLVPILATAYYNLRSSTLTIADSELRNLELISRGISGRIKQLISDTDKLVDFLRNETELINYLKFGDTSQIPIIQESIDLLAEVNPDITPVIVMDKKGNALFSDNPGVTGKNFSFREYFRTAIKGEEYISGIVVGATAGTAGVYFARPIGDQNNIYGVLVVRLRSQTFTQILKSINDENLIPLLIDGDGIILYYPDSQYLYNSLLPLSAKTLQEIRDDRRFRRDNITTVNAKGLATTMINTKKSGTVSYYSPFTKKQEIAGFAPVGINEWVVAVSKSRENFEAPLNQQFQQVLLSVIVVSILIIIMSLKFGRSIAEPIQELIKATRKLQEGNYEKAIVPIRTTDEVGRFARTFNIMIDILRQRERENKLKLNPLAKKHDNDPLGLNE